MYHLERRSALFGLLFTTHPKFKRQIWGLKPLPRRQTAYCANCRGHIVSSAYRPIGRNPNPSDRICESCGSLAPVREVPDQP